METTSTTGDHDSLIGLFMLGGVALLLLLSAIVVLLFLLLKRTTRPERPAVRESGGQELTSTRPSSGPKEAFSSLGPLSRQAGNLAGNSPLTISVSSRTPNTAEARLSREKRSSLLSDDSAAAGAAALYEEMSRPDHDAGVGMEGDGGQAGDVAPEWLREAEETLATSPSSSTMATTARDGGWK